MCLQVRLTSRAQLTVAKCSARVNLFATVSSEDNVINHTKIASTSLQLAVKALRPDTQQKTKKARVRASAKVKKRDR